MTRSSLAPIVLVAAATLALTACGTHPSGAGGARNQPGSKELAGISGAPATDATPAPSDGPTTADGGGNAAGNGGGNGGGGGHPTSAPTTAGGGGTGPRVVSFTATGAVCPVLPKPGAPYSQPGQVVISWKVSGGTGVDLLMDKGLWRSYTGTQGTDTLPFACPDTTKPATHSYTLTLKGTSVSKTISATA